MFLKYENNMKIYKANLQTDQSDFFTPSGAVRGFLLVGRQLPSFALLLLNSPHIFSKIKNKYKIHPVLY